MTERYDATKALLDGTRIRVLRLSAGMSERDLATRIGVSKSALASAENRTGAARVAESFTVNQLRLAAEALGVHAADLLMPDPQAPPRTPDDAQALGALLMHLNRFAMKEDLADALGWPLSRVRAAADELRLALPAVGQRLVSGTRGASVRIAPATAGDSPAEKAADRIRRDAKGMHRAQASVLWHIVNGTFGLRSSANAYRTHYAGLLEQGLAAVGEDGVPHAGEAVLDAIDF